MRKDVLVAVAIAVLIVVLAGSLVYTFVFNVPKAQYVSLENSHSDLQTSYTALQEEKADLEAQLDALEAKYPLRNFGSEAELEDWIANHVLPYVTDADEEYQNAVQTQINAMNEGYLMGIQIDYFSDSGVYWIGNSAIAGGVLYHFTIDTQDIYEQPFSSYVPRNSPS